MKRFAVTGGRKFDDMAMVERALKELPEDAWMLNGCATGADAQCAQWWHKERGRPIINYSARWKMCEGENCTREHRRTRPDGTKWCPTAGPYRNQRMLDSGVELLVAFPGGSGTLDCVRRARKAGIPVLDAATGVRNEWTT